MAKIFISRARRYVKRKTGHALSFFLVIRQFFYLRAVHSPRFTIRWRDRWFCLTDATSTTGFDRHYVFHTAWACRVLAESKPKDHVDISSSLYFVALASAFVPLTFLDYRPAALNLSGLRCDGGDLLNLAFDDKSLESVSCMHVVEHVGLGRYGDPLDYDGDLQAVAELQRVLKAGGQLLFVVPLGGESRIQFNAHRIYTYQQVLGMFTELKLVEFTLIPDDGSVLGLVRHASEELANAQRYGCGCFWFRKPPLIGDPASEKLRLAA